jgi:ketosteroid isomerase-like protein
MPLLLLATLATVPATSPAVPIPAAVISAPANAETDIASVLGRWDKARAQRDVRTLRAIMAKEFIATSPEGRLTREDILAGRAPEAGARLIYREDIAVAVAGDTATFTSRVIRIGTARGSDQPEITRETIRLYRHRDVWRLLSSRSDATAERR